MALSRIVVNVVSARVKMILERPSLLLLEPDDQWQYIRWVPSERLDITWNTGGAWKDNAESGHPPPSRGPILGLKNIGTTSVEDIRVTWRVMSPTSIKHVFLNASAFSPYSPHIELAGGQELFTMERPSIDKRSVSSVGVQAQDEFTTSLDYVLATPSTDTTKRLEIATPIANSILLRIISGSHGWTPCDGPTVSVTVTYKCMRRKYTRRFTITTTVMRADGFSIGDRSWGTGGDIVQNRNKNFLGLVKFVKEPS